MKMKFANEKSEYSHLIMKLMNFDWESEDSYDSLMDEIRTVENKVKYQGDELKIIITTRDTNPMKDVSAPPMSEEDIKSH